MRPLHLFLICTLTTNAVLGTLVWHRTSAIPAGDASAPGRTSAANSAAKAADEKAAPPKAAAAAVTWEQLNAGGMAKLVGNLRAAGFQPQVVYAIVDAMVTEKFALRRYALEFGGADTPYWRLAPVFLDPGARTRALTELGAEQDREMRALLGDDWRLQDPLQVADMKRRFGNLSPEKLVAVQNLIADFRPQLTLTRPTPGQPAGPPSAELPIDLDPAKRQRLAELLTPEELREFDLRTSATALALRGLPGFNATEAEFRAVNDALAAAGISPATSRLDLLNVPAVQGVLSPERYLDYKQALSMEHGSLNRLVARLGQPLSVARQVAEVREQTRRDQTAVLTDNSLSPDQRAARFNGLLEAAATRVGSILGPTGFEAYRQSGGTWLQNRSSMIIVPARSVGGRRAERPTQ